MRVGVRRSAYTLFEVLVVVFIMVLLAATIIPQLSPSNADVKKSSMEFNLFTIRSQIEMYKVHHNGNAPGFDSFVDQMTKPTDVHGATAGTASALKYGPYLKGKIPINPFTGTNTLVPIANEGVKPVGVIPGGAGWQYDKSNGAFYPNNSEYFANL